MAEDKIPLTELQKKASEGDVDAQKALGLLYELGLAHGKAEEPDFARAKGYWEAAAKKGDPLAMFTLGSLAERGEGDTPPDPATATHWYNKAKAAGFVAPRDKLAQLKQQGGPTAGSLIAKERGTKGRSILVVDGSKANRLVARSVLEGLGCTVSEASDGPSAMEKLSQDWNFSLILTEIKLPGQKPMEFIEKIRKSKELFHLPIVVMTDEKRAEVIKQAKEFGLRGWLLKPLDAQAITATARKILKI